MKVLIFIPLIVFLLACSKETRQIKTNNFDTFTTFIDSLHLVGFIIDSPKCNGIFDSIINDDKMPIKRKREIFIKGVYEYIYSGRATSIQYRYIVNEYSFKNADSALIFYKNFNYKNFKLPSRKFDKIKESKTKYYSITSKAFQIDKKVYTISTRLYCGSHILFYSNQFRKILASKDSISLIDNMKATYHLVNDFFIKNMIQNKLYWGKLYHGQLYAFPGDTLTTQDQKSFEQALLNYKKQKGLDTTIGINTALLNEMQIKLDYAAYGFEEYSKKNGNEQK